MDEKVIETRICRQCSTAFSITDRDMEFYAKVSPIFNGKREIMPSPTFCPDCRKQRRFTFRNERKLYYNTCAFTGRKVVSCHTPTKSYRLYNHTDWQGDVWDPFASGHEFDFSRPFFEQFDELLHTTPLPHLDITDSENSDFGNFIGHMKSCYLISASWECEDILYANRVMNSSDSLDLLECIRCDHCYECIDCEECWDCLYCLYAKNCRNSSLLYDCQGCESCLLCTNLIQKKYCIYNVQYDRETYERESAKILAKGIDWSSLETMKTFLVRPNLIMRQCENSLGDSITECKNCQSLFFMTQSQDCKYLENGGEGCRDTYDGYGVGYNQELGYECINTGENGSRQCFTLTSIHCTNTFYSWYCRDTSEIFGCIGLRNKSYCILNKQYTEEQYHTLIPKIIAHMRETSEWGEYFPSDISPFGYNETVAQEYFPLTREEALTRGFRWSDYEPPAPQVSKTIPANRLPDRIEDIPDDILNWAIVCEISGKPFRIVKAELDFYRKHHLPIPHRHPDQRHLDRMSLRNPRKLFSRKCDKCEADMQTTYAPESSETVYCETCYNKEIYG